MKKMISLLIASLLIVQSGFITAFAEDSEHTIFSIDIISDNKELKKVEYNVFTFC